MKNKNNEEIRNEIRRVKSDKETINECGGGYHGTLLSIIVSQKEEITYNGRRIPAELVEKRNKASGDFHKTFEEIDRNSFDRLDKLIFLVGDGGLYYNTWLRWNAFAKKYITKKELYKWDSKREELKRTVYKEKLLDIARRIRETHDNYIEFLESCIR